MKQILITASLLVVTISSKAQDLSRNPQKEWARRHYANMRFNPDSTRYRVDATISNDTLYITDESKLTTIKIGDKFYKIMKHEPTIEPMPPVNYWNNIMTFPSDIKMDAGGGSGSGTVR